MNQPERLAVLTEALVAVQRAANCESLDDEIVAILRATVDEMLDIYLEETRGEVSA